MPKICMFTPTQGMHVYCSGLCYIIIELALCMCSKFAQVWLVQHNVLSLPGLL